MTARQANLFRCIYSLDGECQLYSMPCKEADMCEIEIGCYECRYHRQSKNAEPCRRCDERKNHE